MKRALIIVVLLLLAPSFSRASDGVRFTGSGVASSSGGGGGDWVATFGACTPGTDCFCDLIDSTGTVNGGYSNVIWCADWDHDAYYETSPTHVDDAFGNNNWISTSGAIFGAGDRGGGNRWANEFKGTWSGMTWEDGRPTTTCGGVITSVGGSGIGSGPMEWDKDDRWCANQYEPRIDIIKTAADYTAENGSDVPVIPGSGGAVVFGNYLLGMRVGETEEQGNMSEQGGFGDHAQLGITTAVNYESNISSTGILGNPWKHDEFGGVNGAVNDGLFMFRQGNSPFNTFPIQGFMFGIGFSCDTAIAGAAQTIGTVECVGGNLIYYAEQGSGSNQYVWPDDWDLSEYHCVSAYWDFRTITSVDFKYWFDGELVLDISNVNLDGSVYDGNGGTNGVDEVILNNYSNEAGVAGISAPTRRFMDNYVMRDGAPVLCEDIGFPDSYNQAGL